MHPREHGLLRATYSVNETLALLSIGRTTLYALIKHGELKSVQLGRKRLICASDLAAFLDKLREGREEERRNWVIEIASRWRASVEAIIETGDLLNRAKVRSAAR